MALLFERPWAQQPKKAAELAEAWRSLGVTFQFQAPAGAVDLQNNSAATSRTGLTTTALGIAERSTGGVYPKFPANGNYQTAARSVLVAFVPREGLSGVESRRIFSDFNGTTYSFVLTFDPGFVGLFCHNGTTGTSAQWSTTVTPGVPMVLMGVASTAGLALYANGSRVATGTLSTGLRSVSNGLAIGGNPSGLAEDLEADFLFVSQVRAACPDGLARQLTADWTRVFAPRPIWVPTAVVGSGYSITAQPGSYSVTGQTASIYCSKFISADAGSYSLSGQDATITYTPGGTNYTITANSGTYSITGQAATILRSKQIVASAGSYTLTGQNATINYSTGSGITTLKAGSWIRYRIIT